jgi:pyruvate formate lyase activating enzyme
MSLVFRIRRFSLDDGPGIRTTVFFKGCPLNCQWCHNPEGLAPHAESSFRPELCIDCGDCSKGACVEKCPTGARKICGTEYSIDALVECLLKDQPFYAHSGGGVTLSGGEPTQDMEFVGGVAKRLKAHGIHVALQTCGFFDWDAFRSMLLPHLDLVFCDLKIMDRAAHRRFTGADNQLIMQNLARMSNLDHPRLIVRTPLVPGITDSESNLDSIRQFLSHIGHTEHRLLPFNPTPLFQEVSHAT